MAAYHHVRMVADLPDGLNHVVVIVIFGSQVDSVGRIQANNDVATAFLKHVLAKE